MISGVEIPKAAISRFRADLYTALALLLIIGIIAFIYRGWIGHALVGLASIMLLVIALVKGAMLTGRIQKGSINPFKLHGRAGLFLFSFLLSTFLYGLWIRLLHDEPLLRSVHGWLGLIIVIIAALQVLPSLMAKERTKLRPMHRLLGYSLAPLIVIEATLGLYEGVTDGGKNLVLLHSLSGGLAALALTWVVIELLYLTEEGVARARIASYLASFFIIAGCWIAGGYNYRTAYGVQVRPVILAGSSPWAHLIVMEAKEHIFIFLPIIALAISLTLATMKYNLLKNPKSRRALAIVASLALFLVLVVFLMGAIISNAGKTGMEV
jgi:hypothetical protein